MNANRNNSASTHNSTAPVATLAEAPEFEVEALASYEEFSRHIDEELARLERQFAAFCTHDSLRLSSGR